jgi:hypothetical protein
MIRWDWRPPKTCDDCGYYRGHDNHKTFERCNKERPGDPCLKPESHHKFVLAVAPQTEPRATIVHAMAASWQARNLVTRMAAKARRNTTSTYIGETIPERRDQLWTLRRIWRAAREEAD